MFRRVLRTLWTWGPPAGLLVLAAWHGWERGWQRLAGAGLVLLLAALGWWALIAYWSRVWRALLGLPPVEEPPAEGGRFVVHPDGDIWRERR